MDERNILLAIVISMGSGLGLMLYTFKRETKRNVRFDRFLTAVLVCAAGLIGGPLVLIVLYVGGVLIKLLVASLQPVTLTGIVAAGLVVSGILVYTFGEHSSTSYSREELEKFHAEHPERK